MADTDLGTWSLVRSGPDIDRDLLAVLTRKFLESKIFYCPQRKINFNFVFDMNVVTTSRPIGMICSILPSDSYGS